VVGDAVVVEGVVVWGVVLVTSAPGGGVATGAVEGRVPVTTGVRSPESRSTPKNSTARPTSTTTTAAASPARTRIAIREPLGRSSSTTPKVRRIGSSPGSGSSRHCASSGSACNRQRPYAEGSSSPLSLPAPGGGTGVASDSVGGPSTSGSSVGSGVHPEPSARTARVASGVGSSS